MNHAILFAIASSLQSFEILVPVSGQSNEWYNWFENNKGNRYINNGVLPTLSCPYGYYRQFKSAPHLPGGINLDGCLKCPKGFYGESTNLTSPNCTAPCPLGTYSDEEGVHEVDRCKLCPAGTYGDKTGLTTPACSGRCTDKNKIIQDKQYFSVYAGLVSSEQCELCPSEYQYHSCKWNTTSPKRVQVDMHYQTENVIFLEDDVPDFWDPIW